MNNIIRNLLKKLEYKGLGIARNCDYYEIAGNKLTYWRRTGKFECTCKWHTIKNLTEKDRNKDCIFIQTLRAYFILTKKKIQPVVLIDDKE